MKILFVITSWDFGGAETQVFALAESMQKTHKVLVVSLIPPNTDFLNKTKNIKVISLDMKRGFPDLRAIFRLKRIVLRFNPDVVHAHMIHAVVLSRVTRIFIKIPKLISTAHNINEGGKLRTLLYHYTDRFSDVNTNVSQAALANYLYKRIFPKKDKSVFVPNGIAIPNINNVNNNEKLRTSLNIAQNVFIWLAVGRLELAKDYINLIKAVALLKSQTNENFVVLIAGEGSEREKLENYILQNKLSDTIKLLGRRDDISDLLNLADTFIMSSAWEGLPIAILEAASHQKPCVVTDVGGCGELVKDGVNGFLVPPKNENALADAMQHFMKLSLLEQEKMGAASLTIIKSTYALETIVSKWIKIYNS